MAFVWYGNVEVIMVSASDTSLVLSGEDMLDEQLPRARGKTCETFDVTTPSELANYWTIHK